jgi:hypothetical protein
MCDNTTIRVFHLRSLSKKLKHVDPYRVVVVVVVVPQAYTITYSHLFALHFPSLGCTWSHAPRKATGHHPQYLRRDEKAGSFPVLALIKFTSIRRPHEVDHAQARLNGQTTDIRQKLRAWKWEVALPAKHRYQRYKSKCQR